MVNETQLLAQARKGQRWQGGRGDSYVVGQERAAPCALPNRSWVDGFGSQVFATG